MNDQEKLDKAFSHIAKLNEEMGIVQVEVSHIKLHIGEIKEDLKRVINRLPNWAVATISLLTALLGYFAR